MNHNLFKKAALLAFGLFVSTTGFAQKELRNTTVEIKGDLRGLKRNVTYALRDITTEVKRIDFQALGDAISVAAERVAHDIGDVKVIVVDDQNGPEVSGSPGVAEASKTISKTYNIGKNDKLAINNQFGKVVINTWTKNEIKVDIEIKAFESSENTARELLERVSISDSRQNDLISFKTNFEKNANSFWSRVNNGREEKRGLQVNYQVYMPAKNALDLTNRYGSTVLPDMYGPINVTSAYGSFSAGKLDNAANQVKVSYGSAVMDTYANGNLSVTYGSLKLENADKVNATIKYSGARIDRLINGGTFDLSYTGGFRVNDVGRSVKNLVINSSYSSVTLGIDESADLNFDVTVSYAGFNYTNDNISLVNQLTDQNKKGWSPTKNYKGTIGKGSDSRIIIKSNYGGVKFL